MRQVQINHPALVALQGRLQGIASFTQTLYDTNHHTEARRIRDELHAVTQQIDQWLTDSAKQVADEPATLARIAAVLSGQVWSADTPEQIAGILRGAGYMIADAGEAPQEAPRPEADTRAYKVVRRYQRGGRRTIIDRCTLGEAQAHCQDPETSWRTAISAAAKRRTRDKGPWFDGYEVR